jgi:hypothetical protein
VESQLASFFRRNLSPTLEYFIGGVAALPFAIIYGVIAHNQWGNWILSSSVLLSGFLFALWCMARFQTGVRRSSANVLSHTSRESQLRREQRLQILVAVNNLTVSRQAWEIQRRSVIKITDQVQRASGLATVSYFPATVQMAFRFSLEPSNSPSTLPTFIIGQITCHFLISIRA